MKKSAAILIFVVMLFSSVVSAQTLEQIRWYTEEYPPYNYLENDVPKGISVEILLEMWKKVGINKTLEDIQVVPWARGVKIVKHQPGTCLFATTLTKERSYLFGWKFVYPIPLASEESKNQIIAKKSKKIKFNSIDDLKKSDKKIGVVRGDIGERLLLDAGINLKRLVRSEDPKVMVKKLDTDSYDIISYGYPPTVSKMKELGIDPTQYENVFSFPAKPQGYAFHHSTDLSIIRKFQKALDELHKDGTAEKIMMKYVNTSNQ